MIATRERIRPSELLRGFRLADEAATRALFDGMLPLDDRHCLFINQGKAAFELIVLAAGLSRSKILMPAFFPDDFVGVVRKYEITPVFVDVDPQTYQIDLDRVTEAQLEDARALIVLHTFGLPADGLRVRRFCEDHGLVMIEDCARALGAKRDGRLVGSFGHYALFSLPKVAPVRQGGVLLSEEPVQLRVNRSHLDLFGVLHALSLVRYPGSSLVEGSLYSFLADTPLYPREVGNYDPLPIRELDWLGRSTLAAFMPLYPQGLVRKRACAQKIREVLATDGFEFQADDGTHIFTAVGCEPPAGYDSDELQSYLLKHGVKANAMWRGALGVSDLARLEWGAQPEETPVAQRLSRRLIQLPASRFQTPQQTDMVIDLCRRFLRDRPPVSGA